MPPVNVSYERVVVETDRYRVEGDIILPQEGYRNLPSDYINYRNDEFLCLVNVEIIALDGSGQCWNPPVLILKRRHIHLIVPIDHHEIKK